jgi:hypothetical protein
VPIVPATLEANVAGSLKYRNLRPAWATQHPCLKKKTKIKNKKTNLSWMWSYTPVIPTFRRITDGDTATVHENPLYSEFCCEPKTSLKYTKREE